MKRIRRLDDANQRRRRRETLASQDIERAQSNGPPTAFLIWKAGMNVTDHGPTVFSERSAKLLMAEQATRGNRYSMDVDHLSLNDKAPIENRRAVGWFALEVRDGDLWAVQCEWTDTVVAGLTKDPPEWKYFSPAYDVDQETGEVVSFLNCALTNNPATHNVTALASRGESLGKHMKYAEAMAALSGDDEDKKAAAKAAIKAAFGEDDDDDAGGSADKKSAAPDPDKKDADASDDDDAGDDGDGGGATPSDDAGAADDEKAPDDKDSKKSSKAAALAASMVAAQDLETRKLEERVKRLEKDAEDKERKTLIAGRVMSSALAKKLASSPLSYVRDICAELPIKQPKDLAASAKVQATRGANQTGDAGERTSHLPPDEREELNARMGLGKRKDAIRREGNAVVYGVMTREEARAHVAAKSKEGVK
jgi:hypothetical protein